MTVKCESQLTLFAHTFYLCTFYYSLLFTQDCMEKGGKPMGSCASGFGVCCHFQFVCNSHTRENGTYWVNPATPQPMCHLMVTRMNSDICQIKLELDVFEIAGPNAKVGSLITVTVVFLVLS